MGIHWQEFSLGDFALTDSPGADFIESFPLPNFADAGQINVYEVDVSGADAVHFDLYGYTRSIEMVKSRFAPFSHDVGVIPNPGPTTLLLLGAGLVGLGAAGVRLKGRRDS